MPPEDNEYHLDPDLRLCLSAQSALLGQVTPELRSVSLDLDIDAKVIRMRCIFDGEPRDVVWDSASRAATLIIADYPYSEAWSIEDEYLSCPAPQRMDYLRLVVYQRCEDEWVIGDSD